MSDDCGGDPARERIALFAHPQEIHLSERALSTVRHLGILWVGELVQRTESELLRVPGAGRKTVTEISNALKPYGLRLGMHFTNWSNAEARQVREQLKGGFRRKLWELNPPRLTPAASLNEELSGPVSATQSARNAELLLSLWGFDGSPKKTLESVGACYSMSRERVRQIEARATKDLQTSWHELPLLDKAVRVLEENSPMQCSDLSSALEKHGIQTLPISGKSLITACKVFERNTKMEIGGRNNNLIGSNSDLRFVSRALRELKRATHSTGCTSLNRICLFLGKSLDDAAKLRDVFVALPEVIWLGPDNAWAMSAGAARNRLFNYLRKIFAVAQKVHISELRQALNRPHRMEFVPPSVVLLDVCRQSGFVKVTDSYIESTINSETVHFGEVDTIFIDAFRALGSPCTRESLEDYCVGSGGMNINSFYVYLTYSPLFLKYAPGVYGFIGCSVPPGSVEIAKARIRDQRIPAQQGWTSNGQLWCLIHIPRANLRSGTFFLPSFIMEHAEGSWSARLPNGVVVGQCDVRGRFASGLRDALELQGAEPDDFCLMTFDMPSKSVVIDVGGPDLEDRAPGGRALDLELADDDNQEDADCEEDDGSEEN